MHCRPFANIAHGNNSLVADRVALKVGEYLVTESGFGSDMGMEKLFDITCRIGGLRSSAVVLVATVRALKHHGGNIDGGMAEIEGGAANLARHIGIVKHFGLNAVVAVNKFPTDTAEELELVRRLAIEQRRVRGRDQHRLRAGRQGRDGPRGGGRRRCGRAERLPLRVPVRRADRGEDPGDRHGRLRRRRRLPAQDREGQGGGVRGKGLGKLPICMAKTHLSLSHDAALLNAPTGFTVTVRDLRPYTGAGWIVALCGDMQTMPGLGKSPGAFSIDVDERGNTVGLF